MICIWSCISWTTKLQADIVLPVSPKIGHIIEPAACCFSKLAAILVTEVRQKLIFRLPPGSGALCTVMSPDVDVVHFPAFPTGLVLERVQIFERGSCIVLLIHSESWKITRHTPVAWLLFDLPQSTFSNSVFFPVWSMLFSSHYFLERGRCKILISPSATLRHD